MKSTILGGEDRERGETTEIKHREIEMEERERENLGTYMKNALSWRLGVGLKTAQPLDYKTNDVAR